MTLEVLEVSRPQAVHTNMLGRETVQVCVCVCVLLNPLTHPYGEKRK